VCAVCALTSCTCRGHSAAIRHVAMPHISHTRKAEEWCGRTPTRLFPYAVVWQHVGVCTYL